MDSKKERALKGLNKILSNLRVKEKGKKEVGKRVIKTKKKKGKISIPSVRKLRKKAKREIRDITKTNIYYPLIPRRPEEGPIFAYARIFWDEGRNQLFYRIVEPSLSQPEKETIEKIKKTLQERLEVDFRSLGKIEAKDYLEEKIEEIFDFLNLELREDKKRRLKYYLERDFIGYGKIEPLMRDPNIEDISCDGTEIPIFVFHRDPKFGSMETNVVFNNNEELNSFVMKLAQRAGRSISMAEPLVDASLPDGSRLQATLATDIARRGSNFTVRKFTEKPLTPVDLMNFETIDSRMLAYLWFLVEHGKSVLVSGGTATGKTSMLNSLSLFIPPEMKVISIEDSVSGSTDFLYRNENRFHRGKVGEYIDEIMEDGYEQLESGHQICRNIKGMELPTLNQDYSIGFKKPQALIRHKVNKEMYRIKTSSGKEIEVTGDHSLYVLGPDPEKMSAKRFILEILSEKKFDRSEKLRLRKNKGSLLVNLLDNLGLLSGKHYLVGKNGFDKEVLKKAEEELNYKSRASRNWSNALPLKVVKFLEDNDHDIPENLRLRGHSGSSIPLKFEIDREFSFLVGLVVAHGVVDKERNLIIPRNRRVEEVVEDLSKQFEFSYRKKGGRLIINSRMFISLLKLLSVRLDEAEISSRAPGWLWELNEKEKESFLEGFKIGNRKPLYKLNPKICKAEVRKLSPGDFIITSRKLPEEGDQVESINLLEEIEEFEGLEKFFLEGEGVKHLLKTRKEKIKAEIGKANLSKSTFSHWKRNKMIRADIAVSSNILEELETKNLTLRLGQSSLPASFQLDKLFLEFLGLWIADGCFDHNNKIVSISSPQEETERLVEKFCEHHDLSFGRHSDGFSLNICSRFLYQFLKDILKLKHYSEEKRVPEIIFNLSNEKVKHFLRGYFAGDNDDGTWELGAYSKNLSLLKDISALLLRFGIQTRISEKRKGYRLRISSIPNLKKLEKIGFLRADRRKRFDGMIGRESDHDCSAVVDLPDNFLHQIIRESKDLVGKRWTYNSWKDLKRRYSNSRPGRRFLESLVREGVLEAKTEKELRKILEGDLGFDQITKKENLGKEENFVYDFSIPGSQKFFTPFILCSNTPELRIPHRHWVPEVAREPISLGQGEIGEVDLYKLLRESLRQRPDYIIVGEVRGREAYVLFQQISTGHPGFSTIHAESMERLITRLTTKPIDLPANLIESLDLIVFLVKAREKEGYVRRAKQILEVMGFDEEKNKPITNAIFEWNANEKDFKSPENSSLLRNIIREKGIKEREIKQEIKDRARVLEWLRERGISDYRDISSIITQYYRNKEPLMERVKEELWTK